jgi:hypothetical protein
MEDRNMQFDITEEMLIVEQQEAIKIFCQTFFCHCLFKKLVTLDKMPALRSGSATDY